MIVVTPETNHPHEERILHALVRAYGITIHVRKPGFTEQAYSTYLSAYPSIGSHMVIHEHHILANEFSVKGIHLKEAERKYITEIPNDVKIISTGFHNVSDVKNNTHTFDYIFYSPLFKSISKADYGTDAPGDALAGICSELKNTTTIPVMGLGGINEANISLVKKSGFDGAALLGAVWESGDPIASFDKIYTCLQ